MLFSENCDIIVMRIEALDMALESKLGKDYHKKHPNILAAASISVTLERLGDNLSQLTETIAQKDR